MLIRNVRSHDQKQILSAVNEWWGGRDMAHMLPSLFFHHFTETSFIVEENEKMIGFLIGFLSQTNATEAYIHFVGVHPNFRKKQIGSTLYRTFFDYVHEEGRKTIRCITSLENKLSITYHQHMGFEIEPGNKVVDGIEVVANYDGPGKDRVRFVKNLSL
ncbi:GNAT family N-acetyltransferase [Alkalicoccobacillus murimartini]|uniref:Ribosomal protein S18 acetylase RimI-like enzyme n=1 Tax=Alkalicoccobacillus murimartini TaxID=171685 RepID=A0ABT9YCK8_9BACI|nr:GNAT family N-acetyltransferase [Alkalicoccobacillus murimartini]MDQ0205363.1 ribosomal protein S18 acetylase RimI-like enzyme [Alkalicoccobacillus murimartini]